MDTKVVQSKTVNDFLFMFFVWLTLKYTGSSRFIRLHMKGIEYARHARATLEIYIPWCSKISNDRHFVLSAWYISHHTASPTFMNKLNLVSSKYSCHNTDYEKKLSMYIYEYICVGCFYFKVISCYSSMSLFVSLVHKHSCLLSCDQF